MAVTPPDGQNDLPIWGWLATGASAIGGAGLVFWKWFISNRLNNAGSNAQLDVINMLKEQLDAERTRSEQMMKSRDDAFDTINQLKLQIAALTLQVQKLEATVKAAQPPATSP